MVPMIFENHLHQYNDDVVQQIFGNEHLPLERQYNVNLADHFGFLNIPDAHDRWAISKIVESNNRKIFEAYGFKMLGA